MSKDSKTVGKGVDNPDLQNTMSGHGLPIAYFGTHFCVSDAKISHNAQIVNVHGEE